MANRAFLEEKNENFGELARISSYEAKTPYLGFSVFWTFWGFLVIFWVLKNELFPLLKNRENFARFKKSPENDFYVFSISRGLELREKATILTMLCCIKERTTFSSKPDTQNGK